MQKLNKKEALIIRNMLDDYEEENWGGMSKEQNKAYIKARNILQEIIQTKKGGRE